MAYLVFIDNIEQGVLTYVKIRIYSNQEWLCLFFCLSAAISLILKQPHLQAPGNVRPLFSTYYSCDFCENDSPIHNFAKKQIKGKYLKVYRIYEHK
jgi:hypothetical protein